MSRDFFDREHLMNNLKDYGGRGLQAGMGTLGGFQKFLLRGNVVDLAVGVVIGTAFSGLVQAFVKDFLQPLIGGLVNSNSFDTFTVPLHIGKGVTLLIGAFIGVFITFLLTAAVVYFFVVKPINTLHDRYDRLRPKKVEAPTTRECPFCLSTVPLKATRCAFCTSPLLPVDNAQVQGQSAL
jgi:large conductance mechanosensitive channel